MTLEKAMVTINIRYCILLFLASLNIANAQEMKGFSMLDSLRSSLSLTMDSTWLIRQETLAEQVEEVLLFGFKDKNVNGYSFYFDPSKKVLKVDSLFKVNKKENNEMIFSILKSHLKYARMQPRNLVSGRPDKLKIIFSTLKAEYQYYSTNSDLIFFSKTMKIIMHDRYSKSIYSESQVKKKKRK
jgi:hypothetical protein